MSNDASNKRPQASKNTNSMKKDTSGRGNFADHQPEDLADKKGRHTISGPQELDITDPTRGSSMQGPKQAAKGGPAGANQGGAPRGANRLEPSHQRDQRKKDRRDK